MVEENYYIDDVYGPIPAFFVVDSNHILQPLGVKVIGDSRHELLPSTRDNTDTIPGRHGEIDFGTELKPRLLELHVATDEGLSPSEKANLQRLFAKHLDPTKGTKTLIFADDIEKTYIVKYAGKIDLRSHPTWFDFVIPFKMSDPFIIGTYEKRLTGSGTLINNGTHETGLIIEIHGPTNNPEVTIGDEIAYYQGEIPAGQMLKIDTFNQTAKIGSHNVIDRYNDVFPLLSPGEIEVMADNTTIKWRDKWI